MISYAYYHIIIPVDFYSIFTQFAKFFAKKFFDVISTFVYIRKKEMMRMSFSFDEGDLDSFIAGLPIFEYRVLDARSIAIEPRIRAVCEHECDRYGTTWACPPAVGTLDECRSRVHAYETAVLFSSVAEVAPEDIAASLATRREHELLTDRVDEFFSSRGAETLALSTESCDLCESCSYLSGSPCVRPNVMRPCIESHGIVVSALAEEGGMTFMLPGAVLWFSLILLR